MLTFEPHQLYRSTYERYPELWTAVSSPKACFLMRGSAHFGYPVEYQFDQVSDIAHLMAFIDAKDPKWSADVRKLIGYMCGHVMKQLGYELVKENVKVPDGTFLRQVRCIVVLTLGWKR